MKLVCISGGAGAAEALTALERAGVQFDGILKAGADCAAQVPESNAGGVFCIGEAGIQTGLFVQRAFQKTHAARPVLAVFCPQGQTPVPWHLFDAVLCTGETQRRAALTAGADPFRIFWTSDAQNAVQTAIRRKQAGKPEKGIVVCGSYGLGNMGDDAMLTAILDDLRRFAPDLRITVISRNPSETRLTHGVDAVHSFALKRLIPLLLHTRFFISGGGTLLTNLTSSRSLRYYLMMIRLAHRLGARVLLYSCGIGPIDGKNDRKVTSATLNRCADAIAVRDGASKKELTALGVNRPPVFSMRDAAFSLRPEAMTGTFSGSRPDGRYAVYAIRPWTHDASFLPALAAAATQLWRERGLRPVFLPMEPAKDLPAAEETAAMLQAPYLVLREPMTFAGAYDVIQHADLVISMRLHALIAASLSGTPFAGVAYDVKIRAFLSDAGSDACVDYDRAGVEALLEAADEALRQKGKRFVPTPDDAGEAILRDFLTEKKTD